MMHLIQSENSKVLLRKFGVPKSRRVILIGYMFRIALLVAPVSVFAAESGNYLYYCPKGDAALIGDDHSLHGRAITAFPLATPNPLYRLSPYLDWTLTDCSNNQYFCLDAKTANSRRRLFVPRNPKVGETYRFGEATALVLGSASFSKVPTIQVVNFQKVGGRMVVIQMTIKRGVGAVYIDGLNFWDSNDYQNGETCVLESRVGYFHQVRVEVPRPKVRVD
jgi:hypothetical protein